MTEPTLPGRQELLQRVTNRLAALENGPANAVIISGDPGIGKSDFARCIGEIVAANGAAVGSFECGHLTQTSSFLPFIKILADLGVKSDLGEANHENGSAADRVSLFSEISSQLRSILDERPMVMIIDEAHHTDESSQTLLRFLIEDLKESPFTIILVGDQDELRTSQALAPTISSLVRADRCLFLELEGLDANGCIELVRASEGRTLDIDQANRLVNWTGGNPFLLNQIVQSGQIKTVVEGEDTAYVAPPAVRFSVLERFGEAGPVTYKVLSAAALIGSSLTFDELTAVCGISALDVASSLNEGTSLGLIRGWSPGDRQIEFSHAFARDVIKDEIPTAERFNLHERIVNAFEEIHQGNLRDYLEFLAIQYEQIGPVKGWDSCIKYMVMAAEKALGVHAYEDATGWYLRALDLSGNPGDGPLTARLLSGLSQAMLHMATNSGERRDGFARQKQAVEMLKRLGDHSEALRVAAITEGSLASATWNLEFIQGIYEETPEHLRDTPDFAAICSKLGLAHGIILGDRMEAYKYFDEAEALLGENSSAADRLDIKANRGSVAGFWHMDHADGLKSCLEAIDRAGTVLGSLRALADSVSLLIRMADVRATLYCDRLEREATAAHDPTYLSLARVSRMMWLTIEGELESAEELYLESRGPGVGGCQIESIASIVAFERGLDQVGLERLSNMVEAASDSHQIVDLDTAVASVTLAYCERYYSTEFGLQIAAAWARQILDNALATPLIKMIATCSLALLNEDINAEGAGRLSVHAGELVPFIPMAINQVSALMAVDRGHASDAVPIIDAVILSARTQKMRFIEAHAIVDRIACASSSDSRRNRRVRDLAKSMTAHAVLERHAGAIDNRKRPGGLTPKEYEILVLMTQGLTNREIAERIDRTIYNVQSHIYNIFPKLEVENRTSAIRKAFDEGYV